MPPAKPAQKVVPKKRGKKDELKEEVVEEPLTIVPPDQVKLTPKQLDEDFARQLTGGNPLHPHNLVSFNYVTKEYTPVPSTPDDNVLYHVKQLAKVLHVDSEENKAQTAYYKGFREMVQGRRDQRAQAALEEGKELTQAELEEDDTQRNQFNFTERAAQTNNPTVKTRVVSTTPPDSANSSGSMTQWGLYDSYVIEYENIISVLNMEKMAKEAKKSSVGKHGQGAKTREFDNPMHSPEMESRLAVVERILNQVCSSIWCPNASPCPFQFLLYLHPPAFPPSSSPLTPTPLIVSAHTPLSSDIRMRRTRFMQTLSTGMMLWTVSRLTGVCSHCGDLRTLAPSGKW